MKCIDEEIPFEIPESWEWCRLGNLCPSLQYGTSEKSQSEGEVAVLRMGNILSSGELSYKDLVFTSNESDIIKYALVPGDLLFNRTNSSEWVGKTAIYRGYIPAIYAGYIIRFRPILLNLEYVNFVMNSGYEKDYCQSVKTDGVNQSNINAQKLAYFLIPVPPSQEQTRLVFEIQNIFSPIATLEENKISLEQLINQAKSKILDLAIRGKLVPQDPNDEPASVLLERIKIERPQSKKTTKSTSDNSHYGNLPFEIPQSWAWAKFQDVFEIVMGQSPEGIYINQTNGCEFHQGKTFFGKKLLNNSHVFTENPTKIADPDSLLISVRAPVGDVNITNRIICIGRGLCALKPLGGFSTQFMFQWVSYFKDIFNEKATGTTFLAISGDTLRSQDIPIPPYKEQRHILDCIESLYEQLDMIIYEL